MKRVNPQSEISAVVIVLNNVQQIGSCIEAILNQDVREIIVVDGGSTDGTIEKVKELGCQLHVIGKTGLSHARQYGIDRAQGKYVGLIDSDNTLAPNCLDTLKADLLASEFVGIAAQKRAFNSKNIYCRFQEWMNSKKVNKPGRKLVIGTPSLYYTDILKSKVRYNADILLGDDADLCYRLLQQGYFVGTGTGLCYEKMVDNFRDFRAKAYLYGRADAEFFIEKPDRRHDIGTHALRNYLLKMLGHAIIELRVSFIPLVFVYSLSRFFGLYLSLLKIKK